MMLSSVLLLSFLSLDRVLLVWEMLVIASYIAYDPVDLVSGSWYSCSCIECRYISHTWVHCRARRHHTENCRVDCRRVVKKVDRWYLHGGGHSGYFATYRLEAVGPLEDFLMAP